MTWLLIAWIGIAGTVSDGVVVDTYDSAEACDVQWLALEEDLAELRAAGVVDFTQTVCISSEEVDE